MGKPQTIIGAERFHFRVRDGIGWFPLAIAARQAGGDIDINLPLSFGNVVLAFRLQRMLHNQL